MPAMYDTEKLKRRFANHKLIKIKTALLAGIQSNALLYGLLLSLFFLFFMLLLFILCFLCRYNLFYKY